MFFPLYSTMKWKKKKNGNKDLLSSSTHKTQQYHEKDDDNDNDIRRALITKQYDNIELVAFYDGRPDNTIVEEANQWLNFLLDANTIWPKPCFTPGGMAHRRVASSSVEPRNNNNNNNKTPKSRETIYCYDTRMTHHT